MKNQFVDDVVSSVSLCAVSAPQQLGRTQLTNEGQGMMKLLDWLLSHQRSKTAILTLDEPLREEGPYER